MTTHAQAAGITHGKRFILKAAVDMDDHHKFNLGDILELAYDDSTKSPDMRRVSDGVTAYVNINRLAEVVEPVPEPTAVHVSLNGNSTTIVVQRNLTADEVAAVLKIVNK